MGKRLNRKHSTVRHSDRRPACGPTQAMVCITTLANQAALPSSKTPIGAIHVETLIHCRVLALNPTSMTICMAALCNRKMRDVQCSLCSWCTHCLSFPKCSPPSTGIATPVRNAAFSEHKNATTCMPNPPVAVSSVLLAPLEEPGPKGHT